MLHIKVLFIAFTELHGYTNRKKRRAGEEPVLRKFEVLFCMLT